MNEEAIMERMDSLATELALRDIAGQRALTYDDVIEVTTRVDASRMTKPVSYAGISALVTLAIAGIGRDEEFLLEALTMIQGETTYAV